MRPFRGRFTLGTLMIAIAIIAVVLAYPDLPFLLAWLVLALPFVLFLALPLAACLIAAVVPVVLVLGWASRRRSSGD